MLFSGDPDDPLDGYDDLLRATAVDAFVITDTYAGTPQADLLRRRRRAVRHLRTPVGRPGRRGTRWVDVDGARGAELATEHLLAAGHERVAWLGWEATSRIGEDRRSGWSGRWHAAGVTATGLGVRITDNVDAARMAAHDLLEDRHGHRLRLRQRHHRRSGSCTPWPSAVCVPGVDVGVVGFDDSLGAQVTWPGLTSVRQPLEQVAIEIVDLVTTVLSLKRPEDPDGCWSRPSSYAARPCATDGTVRGLPPVGRCRGRSQYRRHHRLTA